MFDWDGCPSKMFDIYIEVGEIKKSELVSDTDIFIELWVASCLSPRSSLSECASPVRCPVYDVLKKIRAMSDGRPVCLTVMCDSVSGDTVDWSESISLLIEQLKQEGLLKESVIYTGYSREELENRIQTTKWRKSSDKERFLALFKSAERIIFGKTCHYSENVPEYIQINQKDTPSP